MMKIRKAQFKDLKRIDDIYLEGVIETMQTQFPKKSKKSIVTEMNKFKKKRLSDWGKEIGSHKYCWVVAEIGGEVIGFGNAEISKQNKKEGLMNMLYVDKRFRRQGAGRALTKERMKWLKKQGAEEATAGILSTNKKSINNLEKFGFELYSVKMRKKL